jgi:hypothetical protein
VNTKVPEVKEPAGVVVVVVVIEIVEDWLTPWLLVDVAVTVTLPAPAGAVKVVFAPLAVCPGLNVPQDPAVGPHVQSTPALAASFCTVAVNVAVAPVAKVAGAPAIVIVNVPELDTVTVAEATAA